MLLEIHTAKNSLTLSEPASQALPSSHAELDLQHSDFKERRRMGQVRLHTTGHVHTSISGPDAADRLELEQFIHAMFKQAYGADVKEFMPQLMSLRNEQGQLLAVCGLRHAETSPLFLERYLDAPVEHVISQKTGDAVMRQQIVEIGNLAVARPEMARSLLASISLYLHGTSTTWGVFTGIPSLRNALSKLNMYLVSLGLASLSHLPEKERAAWGRYYDEKPWVMAVQRSQPPATASLA
jgi:hypothetical protein